MATIEREISGYQLIIEEDPDSFSEVVNCHIDDGFQFMNGDGARVDENSHGNMQIRAEMVRYAPERHEIDLRAAMNTPTQETGRALRDNQRTTMVEALTDRPPNEALTRAAREVMVDTRDEETTEEEPVRARTFWTADSPDPFEDDDEFDDDEVNNHQLNRMGMTEEGEVRQEVEEIEETMREAVEVDDRPRVTRPIPTTMMAGVAQAMGEGTNAAVADSPPFPELGQIVEAMTQRETRMDNQAMGETQPETQTESPDVPF